MSKALIGHTGFVGSTLSQQDDFLYKYNSKNIEEIKEKEFGTVVCAGAPGQKWLANKNSEKDLKNLEKLMAAISSIKCMRFILISTVDVFSHPCGVDEMSKVWNEQLEPYGHNRRKLEQFVEKKFKNSTIVRLPALVGQGLRKNAIFDLAHNNNVDRLRGDAVFQFYPIHRLAQDIDIAEKNNLSIAHLTAAPVRLQDIAREVFCIDLPEVHQQSPAAQYDFKTRYSTLYGKKGDYQVDRDGVFEAIKTYKNGVDSESKEQML